LKVEYALPATRRKILRIRVRGRQHGGALDPRFDALNGASDVHLESNMAASIKYRVDGVLTAACGARHRARRGDPRM
jgi:hypothetical protein